MHSFHRRAALTGADRKLRTQIAILLLSGSLFFLIVLLPLVKNDVPADVSIENEISKRHRRSVEYEFDDCRPRIQTTSNANSSQFPADIFSLQTRRRGGVIVHIGLLIYMFVALAVVCDEFFVPSLSVITEVLAISDDVAGATFMAAGGSAPEFFTSLFGVFVAQDNVGVGTIVGSATFNILCVLAFCTLFSRQVLHLTWWPLFRDMSFYTLSLFLLLIFFGDEVIEWQEALVMFSMYIAYGFFMKFNGFLELKTKQFLFRKVGIGSEIAPETIVDAAAGCTPRSPHSLGAQGPRRSFPMIHGGQEVRKSIAQLVIGDEDDTSSSSSSSSSERSNKIKPVSNGVPEIRQNGRTIMVKPANDPDAKFNNQNSIKTVITPIDFGDDHTIVINNNNNGKRKNGNNGTYLTPVEAINPSNGHLELAQTNGNPVPPIALDNLSIASSTAEKPLDLSWPEANHKKLIYLFLAPITFPLAYTLPDVRKPSLRKFFAITFIGAILWIAAYSYLMVWWANTIGETFGIPTEIMGLTILAAGTSIPDLITSVIVARKGLGDMAVSSSIGSNLFDVCVGLPIPWLIHFAIGVFKSEPTQNISVTSNGLVCSLGLLFAMLIVLLTCVAISRWKMDKFFGLLMIFSYCGFCMLCILLETGHLKCPLRNSC
ncbi:Sodium/calcium exchanger membrane region domain-containing protein [Caenorhabditis elegans]|uniref:Sodium/calcium exchanger membrane region domain-containing protein n=1 Tax=Caenorhabditis elegans TaxID=6239 RepID=G5EC02_CAEEL|nr:Sodium/calcium exchanger membrane region domain-containing protein [Caenorhabditis elegans]CAA16315.2 Sodium/calcium exchanger membrane region domain-containing protein [Caenorhabditis elegans]|eukprot:NP_505690.2 Na/Ca eXchangers [Caenorhabditis elegans]